MTDGLFSKWRNISSKDLKGTFHPRIKFYTFNTGRRAEGGPGGNGGVQEERI